MRENSRSAWFGVSTALLLATLGPIQSEDLRRYYFEAEGADGLVRSPYDDEGAKGWYAREACSRACGADGRSYVAAIHDNASSLSMVQSLETPIPSG